MKVKELITKLENLDLEMDILCYSEDENLAPEGYLIRIMEINEVSNIEGETSRDENGIVSIKFGSSELARKYAGIELTSDI